MQCARPREVLVDDLWDDYALRLMQRDYFETPSQPKPLLPGEAAELAAPQFSPSRSGLFLSAATFAAPILAAGLILLLAAAFILS